MFFKKIKDFFFKKEEKNNIDNKLNVDNNVLKDNKTLPMIKRLKK